MDASSSVDEKDWFFAAPNWAFVSEYCQKWQGPRDLYCVDVFSASGKFKKIFQRNNLAAEAFDIQSDVSQDVTSKQGFLALLSLGMRSLGTKGK